MRAQNLVILPCLALGTGAFAWAILGDGKISPEELGMTSGITILWLLIWLFNSQGRRTEQVIFELGRQRGYDDGYRDGRRVARPTVVPFCKPVAKSRDDQSADTREYASAAARESGRGFGLPEWRDGDDSPN